MLLAISVPENFICYLIVLFFLIFLNIQSSIKVHKHKLWRCYLNDCKRFLEGHIERHERTIILKFLIRLIEQLELVRYFKGLNITIPSIFAQWAYDNSGLLTVVDLTGAYWKHISNRLRVYRFRQTGSTIVTPQNYSWTPPCFKTKTELIKKIKIIKHPFIPKITLRSPYRLFLNKHPPLMNGLAHVLAHLNVQFALEIFNLISKHSL